MRNRTRRMKQDVTYWGRPTDDGLGGKTFPSPVLLKCRWQQKAELFRDAEANEAASSAVVYISEPVQTEGWLALGDHIGTADPRNVEGAYEVRQTGASPNLRQTEELHKAWL